MPSHHLIAREAFLNVVSRHSGFLFSCFYLIIFVLEYPRPPVRNKLCLCPTNKNGNNKQYNKISLFISLGLSHQCKWEEKRTKTALGRSSAFSAVGDRNSILERQYEINILE